MPELDPSTFQSVQSAGSVRSTLAARVRDRLKDAGGTDQILRVHVRVPESVRPIDWIRAQPHSENIYWSGRSDTWTAGAVGAADVLSSSAAPVDYEALHESLETRLRNAKPPVRYYGGLRFDATQPSSSNRPDHRWRPFNTYRFVLPRFELLETEDERLLACNLVVPRDAKQQPSILQSVDSLRFPGPAEPDPLPNPSRRTDTPGEEEWTRMVRWALDAIDGGKLDKVVLARRVALALNEPMPPLLVQRHLQAATPGCYHFAIRPRNGPAFVGASPERLFRREGACIVSEAVAGTRPRGDTEVEDERLRHELLTSPKERREHAFVQEAIRTRLERICTSVQPSSEPDELALSRGRHLCSRLAGTLRPNTPTAEVLQVLHPTPAVGGVPTPEAVKAIREQEPFDRGWYAGPVGWIGSDAAEFAVGLRAGLAWKDRVALFSGAGIVEGSEPSREWEEIEQKIGDFAAIMGMTNSRAHPSVSSST